MLTQKQTIVLNAIRTYIKDNGIPPTVREIGEIIGEKTPGAVQGILGRLEKQGVIKRETGMTRSIRLVEENDMYPAPVYVPLLKRVPKDLSKMLDIYNIEKYLPFPAVWVTKNGFAAINPDPNSLAKYPTTTIMLFEASEPKYAIGDILLMRIDTQTVLREYKGLDVFRADFEHRDTIGKTGIVLGRLVAECDV